MLVSLYGNPEYSFRTLGEAMTEEEINAIIEEADVDKDGVIDYAEFFTMMGTNNQVDM